MQSNKPYFQQNLQYTQDLLIDENGKFVMMEWERPIMKKAAEDICKNGGDILNVGFGMGIIDSYIEEHSINSHWIIEAHPEVQKKILDEGWGEKKHVKLIFQPWQEVLDKLPKFDGIYFDTWDEDQNPFNEYISYILKPKGVITMQMGFGPETPTKESVSYNSNHYDASGTNGQMDTRVESPDELKNDLEQVGFNNFKYYITETGPGDGHPNWIFFSAKKN
jgi:hypothetical protein